MRAVAKGAHISFIPNFCDGAIHVNQLGGNNTFLFHGRHVFPYIRRHGSILQAGTEGFQHLLDARERISGTLHVIA